MKERPILFSAPMVRAILEDRKTVTRRIIEKPNRLGILSDLSGVVEVSHSEPYPQWWHLKAKSGLIGSIQCPYGQPGDQLWVKEALHRVGWALVTPGVAAYTATGEGTRFQWKWKNSGIPGMFCPRELSRISLEVTGIRVERLQDITPDEAAAEGLIQLKATGRWVIAQGDQYFDLADHDPRRVFRRLWESINGPGSWGLNPWVWAIEFNKVKK